MAGVGREVRACFLAPRLPRKGIWEGKLHIKRLPLRSACAAIGGDGNIGGGGVAKGSVSGHCVDRVCSLVLSLHNQGHTASCP